MGQSAAYGASDRYLDDRGDEYFAYQRSVAESRGALLARKFERYVKPEDCVLDFGCGGGYLLKALQCAVRIGVEINPVARAEARLNGVECHPVLDDVADKIADVVISNHALEHVPFPIEALRQIKRKLKRGGTFVLCLPVDDWRTQPVYDSEDIHHRLHTWTPSSLGHALIEAGFRVSPGDITVLTHAWPRNVDSLARALPRAAFDAVCAGYAIAKRRRQILAVVTNGSDHAAPASRPLLKNLRAAVIHNHPIHYKHLLFQAMKQQQMDFVVLFQAAQSSIRHEKLPLSQDLYQHRIAYDGPYETAPAMLRARWTWAALQELAPDFLLISGYHAAECWSAWAWGALHRVPRLMWYESNEFDYKRYWFREIFKRIFLMGCCGAHVYGKSNKAYLAKLGMPAGNITIKRAVVDIEKFDTPQEGRNYRADNLTRIIYVGRLAPEKNLPVLLKAFAGAVAPSGRTGETSLRLTIVGTGPDDGALKQQANYLGIAELVEFKGYTPQKELGALYRQADFFVLPSTREPWGLVALEAMLCRLPVIISTQCGCAADVVNANTGWTFSPWDENELAVILRRLESISTEQIRQMGDMARDLASLYSAGECASLVAQSLKKALGTSREMEGLRSATYAR